MKSKIIMEQVSKYFSAEKGESILFITVGLLSLILSIYFLIKLKQPLYSGLSYSFITIAFVELAIGISIYFRSPKDMIRVNQFIRTEIVKIQSEEIPRMETVLNNFVIYRWIEIGFVLMGIAMFLYFQPTTLWRGVGLGLSIQASMLLLLDFIAESRGKIYLEHLQYLN